MKKEKNKWANSQNVWTIITFLKTVDLFVGKWRAIALEFSLEPESNLRVFVAGWIVFGVSVGGCFLMGQQRHGVCNTKKSIAIKKSRNSRRENIEFGQENLGTVQNSNQFDHFPQKSSRPLFKSEHTIFPTIQSAEIKIQILYSVWVNLDFPCPAGRYQVQQVALENIKQFFFPRYIFIPRFTITRIYRMCSFCPRMMSSVTIYILLCTLLCLKGELNIRTCK